MGLDYCLLFGEQYTYAYNLAEERFSADGTYAGAGSEATNDEDRRELEMGVDDAAQVRLLGVVGIAWAWAWWRETAAFFLFSRENRNPLFSFSFFAFPPAGQRHYRRCLGTRCHYCGRCD
jgi:hypothetical protein